MAKQDPLFGCSHHECRHREFPFFQCNDFTANNARHIYPAIYTDTYHDTIYIRAKNQHNQNNIDHGRNGVDHIYDSHHDHIHFTADVSCDSAINNADYHIHCRCHKSNHQTDTCSVQYSGEFISSHLICSKPVCQRRTLIGNHSVHSIIRIWRNPWANDCYDNNNSQQNQARQRPFITTKPFPHIFCKRFTLHGYVFFIFFTGRKRFKILFRF